MLLPISFPIMRFPQFGSKKSHAAVASNADADADADAVPQLVGVVAPLVGLCNWIRY